METLHQTVGNAVGPTLSERVDELIRPHEGRLLSTNGSHVAIGKLDARTHGLEQAIREIALEVQNLSASD